ncbi:DUF4382 domain-containing protein [Noviherbaspirillum sp. UKPF54]|uniref:DUF4382 domain-containing protein n=1 Tax=Noviherbaspirillum sp. UKPF54 TaxID=2601898 RepID=UPI0011B17D4C|nr:DUF4382 domain-containing protein [Noviherbaspirillum sp. UKPF54]QDZ27575.1 DUF4382 domain-containing protein [Noviherbaspirillum sp. UKPF54]
MKTSISVRHLGLPVALSIAGMLAACGGGGDSATAQGTVQVKLTDAPACGFDNVNVTVTKVRINQSATAGESDAGWQDIALDTPRTIDLLTLTNGLTTDLGIKTLPAGHYTQVRLVLDKTPSANSVVVSGATKALSTPSGQTSGLKVNIKDGGFDVTANSTVNLVLDFDACKSIVTQGNGSYALKPVITAFPVLATTGITGITGSVATGLTAPLVTAQQNGVVVKATVPTSDGKFDLSPLPDSSVSYVVVLTADGRTTAAITGVPVTSGQKTAIGTTITPTVSTTQRIISGTATPVAAQALVRATQNYSNGTTVEVGFKNADASTGQYSLTVPVEAPLLGSYSTSAITLAPDVSATAGKYTLQASATGYASQTANVDVGSADATANFTLVPTP